MPRRPLRRAAVLPAISFIFLCLAVAAGARLDAGRGRPAPAGETTSTAAAQPGTGQQTGEWRITARKYAYSVTRIEVQQDDLVKITLDAADIPHSFTIDEPYRIAKRATPGHPVVFEFRADKPGTFEYYCNLKADDGCRAMKGRLVVKPKR